MTGVLPSLRLFFGPRFGPATAVQRRALLRLIAVSAERRIDLAPLLTAWADEEWGRQPWRLLRLAKTLRGGAAIADALDRRPGTLTDEERLLVRHGVESGVLASAIRRELAQPFDAADRRSTEAMPHAGYAMNSLLVGAFISGFFEFALKPEFEKIFDEFGLELPPLAAAVGASGLGFALFWTALLAYLLLLISWFRPTLFRRTKRAFAPWLLPGVWGNRVAATLDRLADSAEAGRPLLGAVSTLARHHYDPTLRHRLLVARNDVELGAPLCDALRDAQVLDADEADALARSESLDARAWTLRALAATRRERAAVWLRMQSGALVPAIVVVFGLYVLTQVAGVFSVLVKLVEALA